MAEESFVSGTYVGSNSNGTLATTTTSAADRTMTAPDFPSSSSSSTLHECSGSVTLAELLDGFDVSGIDPLGGSVALTRTKRTHLTPFESVGGGADDSLDLSAFVRDTFGDTAVVPSPPSTAASRATSVVPSVASPRARVGSVSTSGSSDNIPIDILPHVIREKTGTDRHAAVIASRRRSLSRSRKGNQRRRRSASRKRSTRTQSAAPYAKASGSRSGGADDGHLSLSRSRASKFAGSFSTAAVAGSSSGGPPVDEWGPSMSRSMSIEDDVPLGSSAGMNGMSWAFHEAAVNRTSSAIRFVNSYDNETLDASMALPRGGGLPGTHSLAQTNNVLSWVMPSTPLGSPDGVESMNGSHARKATCAALLHTVGNVTLDLIIIGLVYVAILYPLTAALPRLCNDQCDCDLGQAFAYAGKVEIVRWGAYWAFASILVAALRLEGRKKYLWGTAYVAARLCLQIVRIAFMHAARTSARFVTELAQDALLLVFFAWLIAGRKGAARMYANAIGITGLALYAGLIVVLLPMLVSISSLVDTISVYAFPFFLEGMEALLMMVNAISPRYLYLGEDEALTMAQILTGLKEAFRWGVVTSIENPVELTIVCVISFCVESLGRNNLFMVIIYYVINKCRTTKRPIVYRVSLYKEAALSSKYITALVPVVLAAEVSLFNSYPIAQVSVMVDCFSEPTEVMKPPWLTFVAVTATLVITNFGAYGVRLLMFRFIGRPLVRSVRLRSRFKRLAAIAGAYAWAIGSLSGTGYLAQARVEREMGEMVASFMGSG